MSLSSLFGDDEHTVQEGPYTRLMKVRKWLFLVGGLGVLVALGHFDWQRGPAWIQFIQLPEMLVARALYIGCAYLSTVYALLLIQAVATYDIISTDRFAFRRTEQLEAHQRVVSETERELRDARTEMLDKTNTHILTLTEELENIADGTLTETMEKDEIERRSKKIMTDLEYYSSAVRVLTALLNSRESSIYDTYEGGPDLPAFTDILNAESDMRSRLGAARANLTKLASLDPGSRLEYRLAEFAIDFVRVFPPLLFSAWTLWMLLGVTGWPWDWDWGWPNPVP